MDRKKMNKTELFQECDKRGIGYMSNWTKPMLINRLEEEDVKDEQVHRPIEIWNDIHINLNNKKNRLAGEEKTLLLMIEQKNKKAKVVEKLKIEIKELENSVKTLVDTGMFSYEEKDGMIYSVMLPDKE
tara:strand:- start:55 stop:441 length:387 start_codon:yes stop_codon:yes gene_type:complete